MNIGILLASALPELNVADRAGSVGLWLSSDGAPSFRIASIDGRACLWHAERVAEIAHDLDEVQPLLDRIEGVTGWRFEPGAVCHDAPVRMIMLDDGRACVGIVADGVEAPRLLVERAMAAPPRGDVARATSIVLLPEPIEVAAAAALAPGDIILLAGSIRARIASEDDAAFVFDLATGGLAADAWADRAARFGVAVELTLPSVAVAPDALAATRSGGALMLGAVPEGACVALTVGTVERGTATLIRLGEAWAARIDTLDAGDVSVAGPDMPHNIAAGGLTT